jgi:hypothetical protein
MSPVAPPVAPSSPTRPPPVRFSELKLHGANRAEFRGVRLKLSPLVWAALFALARNRGAVSGERLRLCAWGPGERVTGGMLRNVVYRCNIALTRLKCPLVVSTDGPDVRMG